MLVNVRGLRSDVRGLLATWFIALNFGYRYDVGWGNYAWS